MRTGHWPEVAYHEQFVSLPFQRVKHIRHSGAVERVWLVWRAPGKGGRLIANAQHGRVFQPIAQNIADFTIIHAGGDGGYQDSIYPGLEESQAPITEYLAPEQLVR